MAMLLLPEIFDETWKHFPSAAAHPAPVDFWRRSIQEIRQLQPQVELIAEVYWDREAQLQEIGFDYTYNKKVCDFLLRGEYDLLLKFIGSCSQSYLKHSVHFIENHDEARAASLLDFEQHTLAAAFILFLPGMALLHEGQLEGRKNFARIQMNTRAPEPADSRVASFYHNLLATLQRTFVRRGKPKLTDLPGQPVLVVEWSGSDAVDHALVNFGEFPARLNRHASEVLFCTADQPPQLVPSEILLPPRCAAIVRARIG
jgi:hypothetical protein